MVKDEFRPDVGRKLFTQHQAELELNLPLEPRQRRRANGTAPEIGRMMCSISRVTFLMRLPSGPVGTTTECSAFSFVIPLGNIRGSRSVRRHTQTN